MKLPNAEIAVIAPAKIVRYLLNETHPKGRHKATFFFRFGFSVLEWGKLADPLRHHAEMHEVTSTEQVPEGTKYVIDGVLTTPTTTSDDQFPLLRSVWLIDTGSEIPRFITAYPIRQLREVKND
jgi:hypothetical protein